MAAQKTKAEKIAESSGRRPPKYQPPSKPLNTNFTKQSPEKEQERKMEEPTIEEIIQAEETDASEMEFGLNQKTNLGMDRRPFTPPFA